MAKYRIQRIQSVRGIWFPLSAALVLALGVSPGWSQQTSSKSSQPKAQTAPTSGQKKGKATSAKTAKVSTPAKNAAESASSSILGLGKRDPFKLPEVASGKIPEAMNESAPAGGVLPPGTRGLVISHLMLEGTVREQIQNKMIAVVTNETKRAYFLTENESVYNGVVSKITPDAVYFKENVLDADGRVTTHEVVKRMNPAPGEGR